MKSCPSKSCDLLHLTKGCDGDTEHTHCTTQLPCGLPVRRFGSQFLICTKILRSESPCRSCLHLLMEITSPTQLYYFGISEKKKLQESSANGKGLPGWGKCAGAWGYWSAKERSRGRSQGAGRPDGSERPGDGITEFLAWYSFMCCS